MSDETTTNRDLLARLAKGEKVTGEDERIEELIGRDVTESTTAEEVQEAAEEALRHLPPDHEVGDAAAEIEGKLRSRLDDLSILIGTAQGKGEGWADPDKLEALGVEDQHADPEIDTAEEEAQERLDEYPLCVETTTTFEIVIGTGGPDDRFLIECDTIRETRQPAHCGDDPRTVTTYEIRRALYRYSWEGSAEVVLSGDDKATIEAFAMRVVPELVE